MTFAECIPLLLQGKKITRPDPNGWLYYMGQYFPFDEPTLLDNGSLPLITKSDLEATDWEVVE